MRRNPGTQRTDMGAVEDFVKGFWYPHTSTINWCEMKYVVSHYVAEFFNATTALLFFLLTVYEIFVTRRNFYLPKRYQINYAWFGLVALGSALFHATLRYEMQLLDELPMLYGMSQGLYCVLGLHHGWRKRIVAFLLIAVNIAFTWYYVFINRDPTAQQVLFAIILTLLMGFYVRRAILLRQGGKKHPHSATFKNSTRALKILALSLVFIVVGFGFWLWENGNCAQINELKSKFPPYLKFMRVLLEFHAIWHILSYAGCLYLQTGLIILHLAKSRKKVKLRLKFGIPRISLH
jgi:dihydroceramidase